MSRKITQNLNLVLLSLVLAFFFWVVATEGENPTEQKTFPVSVPVTVSNVGVGLKAYGTERATVRVTLRAPRSVWNSLQTDDLRAYVDLTNATPGHQRALVQLEVRRQPVRVIEISPAEIELTLEPLAEKEAVVHVVLEGTPALGYITRTPALAPRVVRVRGPESLVEQVVRAQITVSVENQRRSIRADYNPAPVNALGEVVPYVEVLPQSVTVNIPLEQLSNFRDVAVQVQLEGQLAPGYRLINIEVEPPIVTVVGRNDVIQAIPGYLPTEPIDLSGLSANATLTTSLKVPEGLSVLLTPQVMVSITLEAIPGSFTLNLTPELQGLSPLLTATVVPQTVAVLLSGPLPLLDDLTPDMVQVLLNLEGLDAGVHIVTPQVFIALSEITTRSVLPESVTVQLRRRNITMQP